MVAQTFNPCKAKIEGQVAGGRVEESGGRGVRAEGQGAGWQGAGRQGTGRQGAEVQRGQEMPGGSL